MAIAIINDYLSSRRLKIHLTDGDFSIVDQNWDTVDSLLLQLQHTETFRGRTRWCDLDLFHYRLMIVRNIAKLMKAVGSATEVELDSDHIQSLSFLVCALVRCLEKRAECHIEMIRLIRVGDIELGVEFEAAMSMEVTPPPPLTPTDPPKDEKKPTPTFSIVVNNTKE